MQDMRKYKTAIRNSTPSGRMDVSSKGMELSNKQATKGDYSPKRLRDNFEAMRKTNVMQPATADFISKLFLASTLIRAYREANDAVCSEVDATLETYLKIAERLLSSQNDEWLGEFVSHVEGEVAMLKDVYKSLLRHQNPYEYPHVHLALVEINYGFSHVLLEMTKTEDSHYVIPDGE